MFVSRDVDSSSIIYIPDGAENLENRRSEDLPTIDAVKDQPIREISDVFREDSKRKRVIDIAEDRLEIKRLKDDNSNLISILNSFQSSLRDVQKELDKSKQEVAFISGNHDRVQTELKIARKQLRTLNKRLALAAENKRQDLRLILELKHKIENLRHQST